MVEAVRVTSVMPLIHKLTHLFALVTVSSTTAFAIVDFESVPGETDDLDLSGVFFDDTVGDPISFQLYLDDDGVTNGFAESDSVFLEATGGGLVDTVGFIYDSDTGPGRNQDEESSLTSETLGDFFVRTDGLFSATSTNSTFVIEYAPSGSTFSNLPVSASGQIWDIDGTSLTATEEWIVQAYDASLNSLASVTSPEFANNDENTSLDGQPWTFSFNNVGSIKYIAIQFSGTKTNQIGLAFDNLSATPIPEPGSLGILTLGIAALGLRRGSRSSYC